MAKSVGVALRTTAAAASLLALAACASSPSQRFGQSGPERANPVQTASIQSASLPPLGPNGNMVVSGTDAFGNPIYAAPAPGAAPLAPLSAPGAAGRDFSTGVSYEKLLGGWTVVSGTQQCRLNLTYTQKSGTSRYRASTPGCPIAQLAGVSSWQLVGNQVQLYDDAGQMVGNLLQAGNRFVGTLAGGVGVSMVG